MLERLEHRLAHMAHELVKGWITGETYSQENGIGEKPDDLFEVGATPSYYWRAYYQVVLPRQVMKHRLECCEHDYIQRRTLNLREILQQRTKLVVQYEIMRPAAMRLYPLPR